MNITLMELTFNFHKNTVYVAFSNGDTLTAQVSDSTCEEFNMFDKQTVLCSVSLKKRQHASDHIEITSPAFYICAQRSRTHDNMWGLITMYRRGR